jgi:sterol desaturase/sphingolipid hydroxylase (fatty acid hydroxylase superfamily)
VLLSLSITALTMACLTLLEVRGKALDLRGRWLNLQAQGLGLGVKWLILPLIALHAPVSLLDGRAMPFWLAFPIFLVAMDLGEYLFHRAQHAIPWLWTMHSLHHSDPDMNATTAERHFWGERLIKSVSIWPAAALVIRPTAFIVLCYGLACAWHVVVHSRLHFSFGKLSWLLNSPAYHRRHHSSEPAHFNSNYSALLPIFDVLTGAYHRPRGFPGTGLEEKPSKISDLALWPVRQGARA